MIKALLKKQFLEIFRKFFRDGKTGKARSKTGTIMYIVLFAFLFLFLGFAFFSISMVFATQFIPAGLDWLVFAIIGILSLGLGVFGSVFNTYASLYHSKDNEMLLSMPIPPSVILFVRMTAVYLLGLLYESLVFIPAIIAYAVAGGAVVNIIFAFIGMIVLSFLILVVTCFLGWIIALISSKLKNKSIITVIVSLVLFGAYYAVCFNSSSIFDKLAENGLAVADSLKSSFYPAYMFGAGCTGDVVMLLLTILAVAALFALTIFVMSRSFVKIATKNDSSPKTEYKAKPMKASGVSRALLRKEFKRFLASATYMLNSSIGTVFMIAAGVLVLIAGQGIRGGLAEVGLPDGVLALAVTGAASFMAAMSTVSAASVSLEGKSIWLIRSLPVEAHEIFAAKIKLHLIMNVPAAIFLIICASIALRVDVISAVAASVYVAALVAVLAEIGLVLDLRRANFDWMNETEVVKQGLPVFISLFGGWVVSALIAGGAVLAMAVMPTYVYFLIAAALCIIAARILSRWLATRGAKMWDSL